MWKAVLFILVSAGVILMGLYSVTRIPYAVSYQKEPMPLEINYEQRVRKENTGIPSYIQIPSLDLYADIEKARLDAEGHLSRPTSEYYVNWYGAEDQQLGQKGVVILAGEFDRENGRPNSFYHLSSLEKNDLIEVSDLNGKKYTYVVTNKAIYDWASTDVQSLLVKSSVAKLNIIIYPAYTEEHSKLEASKTIIYAEMK